MKITKIKLLNWHIFSNETISFKSNLLITGENGCGKSTLMDAIYYLLSGGDDKNFNKAAGQGGNRTLETYMRCKVGNEDQMYVRAERDVISYIVVQLTSENNNQNHILGVCLEINDSSKPKPSFFYIPNYEIKDEDYHVEEKVYSYRDFKLNHENIEGYYDFPNSSNRQRREEIGANIFKIKNYKRYYELLKKAISFNPITEVSSFVNDFLLEDSGVDLQSLINQIRDYRDINEMIIKEKEKLNYLEQFIPQSEKYAKNIELIQNLKIVSIEKENYNNNFKINKYKECLTKSDNKKNALENNIKEVEKSIEDIVKAIADLERNDELKLLNDYKKERKNVINEIGRNNVDLNVFLNDINQENDIGNHFGFKYNLDLDVKNRDFSLLNIHLNKLDTFINEQRDILSNDKFENDHKKKEIINELKDKSSELDLLKKGKNQYDKEVNILIDILKNKINEVYGDDNAIVKPFCEYLEINDTKWANALEGYLNKQRFNLIIDPKYFDVAAKEYERIKFDKEIYGVGLVNLNNIKSIEPEFNSLYTKLTIESKYADLYAKSLLSKVICCEDVATAKNYKCSITKDVMIYKNNVLKACSPVVYKKPFLGNSSRLLRINLLECEIKELNDNLQEINRELEFISKELDLLNQHTRLNLKTNYWLIEDNLNLKKDDLDKKILELENDESLLANEQRIKKYEDEKLEKYSFKEQLTDEKDKAIADCTKYKLEIKNISIDIEKKNEELKDLLIKSDDIILDNYREKFKESKIDDLRTLIEKSKNFNDHEEAFISAKINYYSQHFNSSLAASLYNIKDFINEYYRIKDDDLISYEEKSREAYEVAKMSFKRDFIAKLKEKIDEAKSKLTKLNKKLSMHTFGIDKEIFSFEFGASKDKEFGEYYNIINSGGNFDLYTLLDSALSPKDEEIMKQLFEKITINAEDENQEKMLSQYTDYRNYMSYDIKIVDKNNKISHFSEINKEKSGGETQTPFYIIMAACFEELLGKEDSMCCIILDEAFNNMDEERIKSMMEFYKELNIQVIIIVPTIRFQAIFHYCDSIVGILKNKNRAKITKIGKNENI